MRGREPARRLAGGRGRHRRRQRRSVTSGDLHAVSAAAWSWPNSDLNAAWSYAHALLGLGGEPVFFKTDLWRAWAAVRYCGATASQGVQRRNGQPDGQRRPSRQRRSLLSGALRRSEILLRRDRHGGHARDNSQHVRSWLKRRFPLRRPRRAVRDGWERVTERPIPLGRLQAEPQVLALALYAESSDAQAGAVQGLARFDIEFPLMPRALENLSFPGKSEVRSRGGLYLRSGAAQADRRAPVRAYVAQRAKGALYVEEADFPPGDGHDFACALRYFVDARDFDAPRRFFTRHDPTRTCPPRCGT